MNVKDFLQFAHEVEQLVNDNKALNEMVLMQKQQLALLNIAVSCWVAFHWMKKETHPTKYGKYLICRKDGKIHWETWNGSGWAYNHNEIRFWAVIVPPTVKAT